MKLRWDIFVAGLISVASASAVAWSISGQIGFERGYNLGQRDMYNRIDGYAQAICVGRHKQQADSGAHMNMMTIGGVAFYCRDDNKGYYRPQKKN